MARLDDVGVERPLDQEPRVAGVLAGGVLEHADELVADGLPLGLGVGDAGQLRQEALPRVDRHELRLGVRAEGLLDLRGLAVAHQAVIDVDAGELVANGLVHQGGRHRRVDAAGKPA